MMGGGYNGIAPPSSALSFHPFGAIAKEEEAYVPVTRALGDMSMSQGKMYEWLVGCAHRLENESKRIGAIRLLEGLKRVVEAQQMPPRMLSALNHVVEHLDRAESVRPHYTEALAWLSRLAAEHQTHLALIPDTEWIANLKKFIDWLIDAFPIPRDPVTGELQTVANYKK